MVALTAIFMTGHNEPYLFFIKKIKVDRPPLNCKLCFAWWVGLIYSILMYSNPASLLIAPVASMLAIYLDRVIANEQLKALNNLK